MMQRVLWIDNLKAFAIFSVVVGHMMTCGAFGHEIGDWVYGNLIIPFHMPLFVILSGWFFKADSEWKTYLKKKSIGIALPYITWCIIWFLLWPLFSRIVSGESVRMGNLIWQIKFMINDGLCHFGWWFLRGLFICYIVAFFSVKACRGNYALAGAGSCLLLYGFCFFGIIPNMPSKDDFFKGFVYLYPFFWAGYCLRKLNDKIEDGSGIIIKERICLISSTLFFVIMLWVWRPTDSFYAMNTSALEPSGNVVGWNVMYRTMIRFATGIFGSMMFIYMFKILPASKFFTQIGKETLGIYIVQSLVYWNLPTTSIINFGTVWDFIVSIVVSIVIINFSYFIIHLLCKIRLVGLVCFGKKR